MTNFVDLQFQEPNLKLEQEIYTDASIKCECENEFFPQGFREIVSCFVSCGHLSTDRMLQPPRTQIIFQSKTKYVFQKRYEKKFFFFSTYKSETRI